MKLMLLPILIVLIAGCSGDGSPPMVPAAKAASHLEDAFTTAAPALKASIMGVVAALREEKYDVAYMTLEAVNGDRSLTIEQRTAIGESMHTVQNALSEAILRGDTNALRTVQTMRGNPMRR
jgi:hypothetical protein